MDGFIFYASFKDAIDLLSESEQLEAYRGICEYGISGKEIEFSHPSAYAIYLMAKPQIDANNKRRTDGYKGGRPKKTTGFEIVKPLVSEMKTTGYTNEKPKVKEKDKEKVKEKVKEKENIVSESQLSDPVKEKLREWLQYKAEIRDSYKPSGLNALVTQLVKREKELGTAAVIESINTSMANGWRGLFWKNGGSKFTAGIVRSDYSDIREEDILAN